MQDMREVVHELVVNQLGVKRATYLGHSLGGQLVLGYALTYPEAVTSLVLEAPAGLEEYPRTSLWRRARRWRCSIPPSPATSTNGSRPGTRPGILAAELARTDQGVRDFFYLRSAIQSGREFRQP